MKGQILNILRTETGVVSGGELSTQLGVSRVSVWKHIKKLQESGYDIRTSPRGYLLVGSPDIPYPWEFGDMAPRVYYFDEVGSTMDIARDLARNRCPHFTVVIAGRQKKGKGRLKRNWLSSEGGLYFTIIIRPKVPPVFSSRINFAASMVLARTLRRMFNIHAVVKWPNDILVEGRKLSGLLSEMDAETDMVNYINIGLGINVNNDPTPHEPEATSLKLILGRNVSRKDLLKRFLDDFNHVLNGSDLENIVSDWKRYAGTLNRHVRIVTAHEVWEGFAVDVDVNGALVLRIADGSLKKIIYGDCFHE